MSLPTTVSVGATSGPNASIARPAWIAVGCATLGFVLLGALLFPSAGWDDAYITYWSAYSLADLGRLANINHDFIEQSSSLAFVVALAALRRLSGVDPSILGRVASVAFGVVCIGATALLGNRARTGVAWAAAILVGSATYFVSWAFGGMESTLDACAGVLLLLLTARALDDGMDAGWAVLTFIAVSVYLVARPESIFVLVATLAGLGGATWFRRMRGVEGLPWEARAPRVTLAIAVLCLIAAALMVAFRLWYFGALFPEPVYAKAGGLSPSRIVEGLRYVQANIQSDFILLFGVAALASVAVLLSGTPAWTWSSVEGVCAPFFLAHLGFIVLAGGDGMHGGRFFVPVIPAAAVLCAGFLTRLLTPRTFRALIVVWAAVQLGGAVAFARTQSHSDPLWAVDAAGGDDAEGRFHWFERANHDHRRYFAAATQLEAEVDRVMARQGHVSILSGQSGFVMYHLARSRPNGVRYLDRFALTTRDFRDCRVSADVPRSSWGLRVTIEHYLRRRDAYLHECGIETPDIIYEIFTGEFPPKLASDLTSAGYRLTFVQDRDVPSGSSTLPGRTVARVYIATVETPDIADR